MVKSRSFSIFLLKRKYDAKNSLKDEHSLDKAVKASALPGGATLYVMDKPSQPPWWKEYWGIERNLKQGLKGAIVFLPVKERCFAITFGHTYYNLKEDCYEYDFGLKTTLNALDPEKIKSTDSLQPETAKRERIQSPVASDLTFFDFNTDESIVKKLTGAVKTEYKDIFTNITGSSSLKISAKVTAQEISELCSELLKIYKKEDYKDNFPNIQNIVPVKDPSLFSKLNNKLLQAFKDESVELVLTIPEIIDYDNSFHIKYTGAGRDNKFYDDVYIANYREYLQNRKTEDATIKSFQSHELNIQYENGNKTSFSIYKCFLFDCEEDSHHYHLCEGEWYQIEKEYIEKLKSSLDPIFRNDSILIDCEQKHEGDYNASVAKAKAGNVVCLDKKNIAPSGQAQVEPCDLYCVKGDKACLIHIKISTRSSYLSHLFNQGLNSVELLITENKSKVKLKKWLSDKSFHTPIDEDRYTVIYGIITAKDKSEKSNCLPIFSRISLLRTKNTLQRMRIDSSVVLIKDKVNRKEKSHERLPNK